MLLGRCCVTSPGWGVSGVKGLGPYLVKGKGMIIYSAIRHFDCSGFSYDSEREWFCTKKEAQARMREWKADEDTQEVIGPICHEIPTKKKELVRWLINNGISGAWLKSTA